QLRHVQVYDPPRGEDGRRELHVGPYCLGPGTEGVAIDVDAPSASPVALVYPATGRLVIQMRNALGQPWVQGRSMIGRPALRETQPLAQVLCWWRGGSMVFRVPRDAEGRCIVPFVVLGQELQVRWAQGHPDS